MTQNQTGVKLLKKFMRKSGKVVQPAIKNYKAFLNASKVKQGLVLQKFITTYLRKTSGEHFTIKLLNFTSNTFKNLFARI